MKSNIKLTGLQNRYREYSTNYTMTDNLIFEGSKVIKYENSKQYIEDTNRYHITKELEKEKKKNEELEKIANMKITKEMRLERRWEDAKEYHRKLYLLRNMRWLQQS